MSQVDIPTSLVRTLAPVLEPLTLTEVKDHLRVDTTDEDALIEGLIDAAVAHIDGADGWLGRALVTQTWEWRLDRFPWGNNWADALRVPLPPLQSVTSIEYVDTAGVTQTWSDTLYKVDTSKEPGRIAPVYGETWPLTRDEIAAVTVTFIAGYGANPQDVPAAIRSALLLLIGNWYTFREPTITGTIVARLPMGVEALLMPHRVWGFG
jgi:uncharacterized phiE125 gp8 family phage protein